MKIIFLGTAGGRTVTFKRIRSSGGILLKSEKTLLHIDPGPGAFVNFFKTPYEPWKDLKGIVLSHLHLDHSAEVNTIIESATESGKRKGIKLLAPSDALEGENKVVLDYSAALTDVEVLKAGSKHWVGDIQIETLHRQTHHGVEVYSLLFKSGNKSLIYIPCGKFENWWLDYLPQNVDLMIFNVTFYKKKSHIDHLSAPDVVEILKNKKPQQAILTHFSLDMLKANPLKVAKEIEKQTGVKTFAAEDLKIFEV